MVRAPDRSRRLAPLQQRQPGCGAQHQLLRVGVGQAQQRVGPGRIGVGRRCGLRHRVIQPGDLGQIRQIGQPRVIGQRRRQPLAPARQIGAGRRRLAPVARRDLREGVLAEQRLHRRVARRQSPRGMLVRIGGIGEQPACGIRARQRPQPAGHTAHIAPAQRVHQQLLAQLLAADGLVVHQRVHASTSLIAACARAASSSSTSSAGRSVSHSISVGTAPKRRTAWR